MTLPPSLRKTPRPLLRRRGQHLRAAAGVLCLAEQLSESELRARCRVVLVEGAQRERERDRSGWVVVVKFGSKRGMHGWNWWLVLVFFLVVGAFLLARERSAVVGFNHGR